MYKWDEVKKFDLLKKIHQPLMNLEYDKSELQTFDFQGSISMFSNFRAQYTAQRCHFNTSKPTHISFGFSFAQTRYYHCRNFRNYSNRNCGIRPKYK